MNTNRRRAVCAFQVTQQMAGQVHNSFTDICPWLAPFTDIPDWAIGGSCLLVKAGVLAQFRDIDILCSNQAFCELNVRLAEQGWQRQPSPSHPSMQSDHFACWVHPSGKQLELMSGIKVVIDGVERRWCFTGTAIEFDAGLPWMRIEDWLTLYQLFDRPHRVRQINDALVGQSKQL